MGYALLILGLLAWSGSHVWKRVAPASRAGFGDKGRGLVALASFAGIVLMVLGYRWAPYDPVWPESNALRHVNNLLMLLAFYLFAAAGMKTAAARYIRHPQLWGVRLWAIAHLMVNGDLASFILFGGLLVWAQAEVALINRQEAWAPLGGKASTGKEIGAVVGAVLVMGAVGWIHGMIGPWPFG
ncbi:NnrU family protein [Pararhodobacter sp. CCB-MM2]|uniref:NnrU family protein n=1 Tax=Pararhodobacter sp. CCB-MM2 TaxID=1786003 RepID=UPI000830B84B|nr:NnrU family protein [Pararhodobacter sp. CCB-MM2]MCA2011983.1 NnrU family protein [Cereibacter sphaeroides]